MIRLTVDPRGPLSAALDRAADVIRRGGVAAIPTDTLYALAADAFSSVAVSRVFAIKGRAAHRALPLVAADTAQVLRWFGALPPLAARLAEKFWPGPLTLLLRAPAALPKEVTGGLASVGIRVPAHPVTAALCRACGVPLTATSANVSGRPATYDPDEVAKWLGDSIDLLVDAGRAPGGPPSTIIDVTAAEPQLVRRGAISWDEVKACVGLA